MASQRMRLWNPSRGCFHRTDGGRKQAGVGAEEEGPDKLQFRGHLGGGSCNQRKMMGKCCECWELRYEIRLMAQVLVLSSLTGCANCSTTNRSFSLNCRTCETRKTISFEENSWGYILQRIVGHGTDLQVQKEIKKTELNKVARATNLIWKILFGIKVIYTAKKKSLWIIKSRKEKKMKRDDEVIHYK